MKVATKVVLASSMVMALTVSILTWVQYTQVTNTIERQSSSAIEETSEALAQQLTHWLNGKLELIDLASQSIDANMNQEQINNIFNTKVLKDNFILLFGGLDSDGKVISNDPTWDPADWDARQRPWYPIAKNANHAMLTEPYIDAKTKNTLISVVAKITEKGQFKGAFGGDLSLKTVSNALNTVNFNNAGYAFLVADNGHIISHPDSQYNGKNYQQLFADNNVSLDKKIQKIEVDGQRKWVSFTALKNLRGLYTGILVLWLMPTP